MSRYDFTDPLIREMVAEHHKPKEVISITADGKVRTHSIVCRQCGGAWPCEARRELRTWSKEADRPTVPKPLMPGLGSGY